MGRNQKKREKDSYVVYKIEFLGRNRAKERKRDKQREMEREQDNKR